MKNPHVMAVTPARGRVTPCPPRAPRDPTWTTTSSSPCLNRHQLLRPTPASSSSFSQSAEIFQELQQECMRRLNVPPPRVGRGGGSKSASPSRTLLASSPEPPWSQDVCRQVVLSFTEDKPQIPPRIPHPSSAGEEGRVRAFRWSGEHSLSPPPTAAEDLSGPDRRDRTASDPPQRSSVPAGLQDPQPHGAGLPPAETLLRSAPAPSRLP